MSPTPPRGLRWIVTEIGRGIQSILAISALLLSLYVGYRYVGLVDCLQDRDLADQTRTKAIAEATNAERAADLALLLHGGPELRAADIAAREHTDRVRAANPAPAVEPCE